MSKTHPTTTLLPIPDARRNRSIPSVANARPAFTFRSLLVALLVLLAVGAAPVATANQSATSDADRAEAEMLRQLEEAQRLEAEALQREEDEREAHARRLERERQAVAGESQHAIGGPPNGCNLSVAVGHEG